MDLHYLTVHEIIKNQGENEAEIILSEETMTKDEQANKLVSRLNINYSEQRDTKITSAVFNPGSNTIFPNEFDGFNGNRSDQSFISFSQNTAQDLKQKIENLGTTKGGYLVFADYDLDYEHFCGVFLVRNTDGQLFTKPVGARSFKINTIDQIDFNRMAMGCRINIDALNVPNRRYLQFISMQNEEVSTFFNNWISSRNQEDNRTDTANLFKIIREIEPPIDDFGNQMDRNTFEESVASFISANNLKVDIRTLGQNFYGDTQYFIRYCIENGLELNSEFKAYKKILKRFIEASFRVDKIGLSFPNRYYSNNLVTIDPNHPDRIIITSRKMAERIKEELNHNSNGDTRPHKISL